MAVSELIGTSPKFHALINDIDMVAPVDLAVLIQSDCPPYISRMGHKREGGNAWARFGARASGKRGHRICVIRTVAVWAVIRTMLGRRRPKRHPRRFLALLDLLASFER
jgi:hypothetical protein